MFRIGAAAVAAFMALASGACAQTASWIESWASSPLPPSLVAQPFSPLSPHFSDQTIRQVVRLSAGGRQVRIRFTNEYGREPLRIGAAHVALPGADGAIQAGSDHALTFNGKRDVVIPPGAPMLSDPVDLPLAPLSSLAVSVYFPEDTGPCTCHQVGLQTAYISGPGDFTGSASFAAQSTTTQRLFISGVEVRQDRPAATIVALGDSITDGAVSTPNTNRRWPDRLAERLRARDGDRLALGVANQGISGNRLLAGGAGESILSRLDRDVLGMAGVRYLVVFIGVNDLGVGYGPPLPQRPAPAHPPTADEMIAGYKQVIERAHARGVKVYGATIAPYEGATYWSAQGEAVRQKINDWMRTSGAFDAVIDFDKAWRDPAHPTRIRDGMAAPDHLHGSDAGYMALGDAVDLALFR